MDPGSPSFLRKVPLFAGISLEVLSRLEHGLAELGEGEIDPCEAKLLPVRSVVSVDL